ncbi:MAG: MFS transporter [Acidobacteria bacterium]|nr:MFS transporter [Acidobacteriota bacterium]
MATQRAVARSVAALGEANFRRYFAGQLVSTLGTWMQLTAQVWLVLEITNSGRALGLASSLQFIPALVLGAWAGAVADRVDNRRLLIATNAFAGLSALGLGLLSTSGSLTIGWLYVAAFSIGISNAFDRSAGPAFVTSLVPIEQLSSAIGLYSVTTSASRMIGIAVGGVLIASSGATTCFFINAGSYVLVLIGLLSLRKDRITERRVTGRPVRIRDGIDHVRSKPVLLRTLVTMVCVGMFTMNFMITVPAVVKLGFHADAKWFGLAELFSGAGSTAGGLIVGAFHRPTARTVGLAALALGTATVLTGVAPFLLLFCILMFAVGITATGYMTTSMTVAQSAAAPEMRGRVAALLVMANQGTTPVGALAMGFLMSSIGAHAAMALSGATAIVAGGVLLAVEARRPSRRVIDGLEVPVHLDAPAT